MSSNLTPSEPRISPAAKMSDNMMSALTPPLHFYLAACNPSSSCHFGSWTISTPIGLNRFTFAESRKSDLWTCVCVFTFSSPAFAFLIEMNFNFKSRFAIWSLSPQRFHYYVLLYLSIVFWQYQKYSIILIFVLCLLCVTPLVCSSLSGFAPSSPFFSSWWQKDCELITHTLVLQCSPLMSSRQTQTT